MRSMGRIRIRATPPAGDTFPIGNDAVIEVTDAQGEWVALTCVTAVRIHEVRPDRPITAAIEVLVSELDITAEEVES